MESLLPTILLFIIAVPLAIYGFLWAIAEGGDEVKEHLIGLLIIGGIMCVVLTIASLFGVDLS